ncbi:MAG: LD-carboxypeptidase [Acidimicrobiales bacterium]|nr:LD-carboxypeptidase [Acidimicrobiales bacterium]
MAELPTVTGRPRQLTRPPRLSRGSTLAVVSPAGSAAARFPDRLERGFRALRRKGWGIKEMPNVRSCSGATAGTPEQRAADLNEAFCDPSVDGIICSIGGTGSREIIPLLDFEMIRKNPKVFCGYSDVTFLHVALSNFAEMVTFYGPAVLPDWAEIPDVAAETADSFMSLTTRPLPHGEIRTPDWEVVEPGDWSNDRFRRFAPAPGPSVIVEGSAEGILVGGCLPVLRAALTTSWRPKTSDAVVFCEFPQAPYDLDDAEDDLAALADAGFFTQARAVVFGRPFLGRRRSEWEHLIRKACAGWHYPVIFGIASGHTIPNLTLPLGVEVRVSGSTLSILEPAVR